MQSYLFHLQRTDSWGNILKRLLENYEPQSDLVQCNPASVVDVSIVAVILRCS